MKNNKIEVIKSYLELLNIKRDYFYNTENYEIKNNKRDDSYRCLAVINDCKTNDEHRLVERLESGIKVNISDNLVTIHYCEDHRSNMNLVSNILEHNWMSLVTVKIAYFIIDDDKLVIMIGEDNQCTLRDNLGNPKTPLRPILTLDDISNIKTYSIKIPENFSLNSDITEYVESYLKMKEYSLYKKM